MLVFVPAMRDNCSLVSQDQFAFLNHLQEHIIGSQISLVPRIRPLRRPNETIGIVLFSQQPFDMSEQGKHSACVPQCQFPRLPKWNRATINILNYHTVTSL